MITKQTKRKSYKEILESLGTRQSQVFTALLLHRNGITASELANSMHRQGFFRNSDRNNVHPRLNEMVEMGVVEIIGKRQCRITGKTVAIYKVKEAVRLSLINTI